MQVKSNVSPLQNTTAASQMLLACAAAPPSCCSHQSMVLVIRVCAVCCQGGGLSAVVPQVKPQKSVDIGVPSLVMPSIMLRKAVPEQASAPPRSSPRVSVSPR